MDDRRDPRYRGRRRTSAQRRPGHLRTTYTEEDIAAFANDLVRLQSVWPPEVIEADRKAALREAMKTNIIICAVVMLFCTAALVYVVVSDGAPWWGILVGQTIVLAFLFLRLLMVRGDANDTVFLLYREADRRGIKYSKDAPLYHLVNRLNADYNSHLWNRKFTWI